MDWLPTTRTMCSALCRSRSAASAAIVSASTSIGCNAIYIRCCRAATSPRGIRRSHTTTRRSSTTSASRWSTNHRSRYHWAVTSRRHPSTKYMPGSTIRPSGRSNRWPTPNYTWGPSTPPAVWGIALSSIRVFRCLSTPIITLRQRICNTVRLAL